MIKALISDVSYVLLFPKDESYTGSLNQLYKLHKDEPNFSFFDHFQVNTELLDIYKAHQQQLNFYIFTSDSIQDEPVLQPYWTSFKGIYSAAKMNTHKSDPAAYDLLAQSIGVVPNEVLYLDDSPENITAAAAHFNACQYRTNAQVRELLRELF